jgi:hypothetical protein
VNRPNLVITRQSLLGRRVFALALVAFVIVAAWLMYELGLSRAGFSRMQSFQSRNSLGAENRELVAQTKELRERIAALEMAAKIDSEGYGTVEDELIALQARILEQQEDIEFYKGIVNENDGTGLRIQDFQISAGLGEREYDVRLVLAQAFRSDRKVSGRVDVVIEGVQRGKSARLGLAELGLSEGADASLRYSFRYFQDLSAAVVLPEDFAPERVHVIVKGSGKTAKTVEEFFIWDVKAG